MNKKIRVWNILLLVLSALFLVLLVLNDLGIIAAGGGKTRAALYVSMIIIIISCVCNIFGNR